MSRFPLKFASLMALAIIITNISSAILKFQRFEASGTIYIRADGSIDPITAPIQRDGDIYTLTGNITSDADGIVIERDNTVLDGAGYPLQGSGVYDSRGINLTGRTNVTVRNTQIKNFTLGIQLDGSSNNSICANNMTNNVYGIALYEYCKYNRISGNNITANSGYGIKFWLDSSDNSISGNNIADNDEGIKLSFSSNNSINGNNVTASDWYGIHLEFCSGNSIVGNDITNNSRGIFPLVSPNNKVYHNNFINNKLQACYPGETSSWDDGYPSGGNYWSNYTGADLDRDGIGDAAHVIDENNTDNYPLMGMFSDFEVTSECHVQTVCNSTIFDFQFNGTAIVMNVSGENDTSGFCRICVPTALMNYTDKVLVDGAEVNSTFLPCSNSNNSYLYFNYKLSTKNTLKDRADLNRNGVVDVLDMIVLSTAWNSRPGDPEWKPEADLNEDVVIDDLDMNLLVSVIGENTNIATHEVTIIPELSLLILPLFMAATLLAVMVRKRKHTTQLDS